MKRNIFALGLIFLFNGAGFCLYNIFIYHKKPIANNKYSLDHQKCHLFRQFFNSPFSISGLESLLKAGHFMQVEILFLIARKTQREAKKLQHVIKRVI